MEQKEFIREYFSRDLWISNFYVQLVSKAIR